MQNKNSKAQSYALTEAIKNNIRKGLILNKKYGRGSINKSLLENNIFLDKEVSLDTVKKTYQILIEKENIYKSNALDIDGGLKADQISWLLSGGTAGLAWARNILKQNNILKSYQKSIEDSELNTEDKVSELPNKIVKSLDNELMQVTYVVLVPDETDLHGDIYNETEVRKACHNFNKYCRKANLLHLVNTTAFTVAESYVTPTEFILEDKLIKKGTWLVVIQAEDEGLWDAIKSGKYNGVSIGAKAYVEDLE